jgi:carbon storage regulator
LLCLGRRVDQKILIGSDVVIQVLEIRPGIVRLGIQAPEHITILRSEIAHLYPNGKPTPSMEDRPR